MLLVVALFAGAACLLAYAAVQLSSGAQRIASATRTAITSQVPARFGVGGAWTQSRLLERDAAILDPVGSPSWQRGEPWTLTVNLPGVRRIAVPRSPLTMVALPGAFYLAVFVGLMYPMFAVFSTNFWADEGDGMQNVWNIWWVNTAITKLHQSPWNTTYLHYPYGISLLGHTLNPFNGFVGIMLLRVFSLNQTYNFIILFTFIAAGITAFLLTEHLTQSYVAGLIGGFVFSFSSFHVAHAQLHMQIASLEWIPLFVLCWYRLICTWRRLWAINSAFVLLLVLLCDYYYFFYSVLVATILLIWSLLRSHFDRSLVMRAGFASATFLLSACILIGPLVLSLLILNRNDPLLGAHSASDFALDLPAPFIPGETWRFSNLTLGYWSRIFDPVEGSGYLGAVVVVCSVYVWRFRRRVQAPGIRVWYLIGLLFMVLAVGPVAHVHGNRLSSPVPLPYSLAEDILPVLRLSGVPVRMIVITTLCAAIIVAFGFRMLISGSLKTRIVAIFLAVVLVVEYLPHPLFSSNPAIPPWIAAIQTQRPRGPLIDTFDMPSLQLFYQTKLDVPMAFGYVARTPTSVWKADQKLVTAAAEMRGDVLYRRYGFKYLVSNSNSGYDQNPTLYRDGQVAVYALSERIPGTRAQFTPTQPDVRAGELIAGHSLGQTFTARFNGLSAVGLYLTNYGLHLTGPLIFHLRLLTATNSGPDLARISIDLAGLTDNSVRIFRFRPVRTSAGHRYYAYLEAPESRQGNAPSAAGSAQDTYSGGSEMIDNVRAPGDLVVQMYYTRQK